MLYYKELLQKSYETSKEISDKLNLIFKLEDVDCRIELNDYETYDYDATLYRGSELNKVEFKQRQDYEILKAFKDECRFDYFLIQADSVRGSKKIYIVYDLSLKYVLWVELDDIDTNEKIVKWNPKIKRNINYFKIKKALIINLSPFDNAKLVKSKGDKDEYE